jgi:hypothetical protein
MKKAMWYHLGTAAFGSLIIAIIKTIRAVIAYLQNQAKKSKNKALQMVLCAIQCYMWCLEKCMKFLNKNAYIQTAIYGYSFCKVRACESRKRNDAEQNDDEQTKVDATDFAVSF